MDQRHSVTVAIVLQTHVPRTCLMQDELLYNAEVDPACAFAPAVDLVRHDMPYLRDFRKSAHELLSEIIAAAPADCSQFAAPAVERVS
jgi:hypothetical protein